MLQHTAVSKRAVKEVSDDFLSVRHDYRRVLPDLAGTKSDGGVTVHDANAIGDLFDLDMIHWPKGLWPRIFTNQAVTMQDATVFKFTMQHAAGDAVGMSISMPAGLKVSLTAASGLYKAAAAFCEGLGGDIHKRPNVIVGEAGQ
jgi:hypothetical protein